MISFWNTSCLAVFVFSSKLIWNKHAHRKKGRTSNLHTYVRPVTERLLISYLWQPRNSYFKKERSTMAELLFILKKTSFFEEPLKDVHGYKINIQIFRIIWISRHVYIFSSSEPQWYHPEPANEDGQNPAHRRRCRFRQGSSGKVSILFLVPLQSGAARAINHKIVE